MIKKILVLLTILMMMPLSLAEDETTATTPPATTEPAPQPAETTAAPERQEAPIAPPTETPPPDAQPQPVPPEQQIPPSDQQQIPPPQGQPPEQQPQIQVPEGCSAVTDSQGIQRVRCPPGVGGQVQCPSEDEQREKEGRCIADKGQVTRRTDPNGCTFIECQFGQAPSFGGWSQPTPQQFRCPSPEEMSQVKAKCDSIGLKTMMKRVGECSFAECAQEGQSTACPQPFISQERKDECAKKGGELIKRADPQGCPIIDCLPRGARAPAYPPAGAGQGGAIPPGQGGAMPPGQQEFQQQGYCQTEIPKESFQKCSSQGGQPVVKRDQQGCVIFYDCLMRGNEQSIEYEQIDQVPSSAKILSAVLQLERLKIEFDKLEKELESIARYHEGEGNKQDADKFFRAAGMLEASKSKITSIETNLRDRVNSLTVQDIMQVKSDIRYITDVIFKDVLYVILGGEEGAATEANAQYPVENGVVNCGKDGRCFEENFRICAQATFLPPEEKFPPTVTIKGVEDKECVVYVEGPQGMGGDMTCKIPDYAFARLDPQTLPQYCEGPLADFMVKAGIGARQQPKATPARADISRQTARQNVQPEMLGCEKVARGLSEKGVCGNECCEPGLGENENNCPQDCTGQGEFRQEGFEREEFGQAPIAGQAPPVPMQRAAFAEQAPREIPVEPVQPVSPVREYPASVGWFGTTGQAVKNILKGIIGDKQ